MNPVDRGLKILLWTYIPTHHQAGFVNALRESGVDLVVHYFKAVSPARLRLGWSDPDALPAGEKRVAPELASLESCADWRQRIHVVPGYGCVFLLKLAVKLSLQRVPWVNWCEPSRDWARWYLTYPMKRFYAALINHYSLGALAIGVMARQDFIRWGVNEERIRFLPYSVSALQAPLGVAIRQPVAFPQFVFVGALCHRKGIDVLLKAFRYVARLFPDARLRLVGSDESAGAYERLARDLAITQAVDFAGSVSECHVAEALANCDVLVLPSRFDGWGMVVNEAASMGKALIATDRCGAAYHLIEPGSNGFRVPADDADALAEAMASYCRDPGLIHLHGVASKKLFARFTPERNAVRMRKCLSSLASHAPSEASWEAV